ncbi:ArsR/SmtB family transcription factor [Natronospira sp.]
MKITDATEALSALAQPSRLSVFRWLVRQYPARVAAGEIGQALDIAPATLSFHLATLERAGLLQHQREGRSRLYLARLETMNALMAYLFEDCCNGNPAACPDSLLGGLRGECGPGNHEKEKAE